MEKYTISTTIYIYEDKPEYYLHGNRLQYVQSQNKQTETHKLYFFIFFGEKLQLHVKSPKNERGNLAEIQILTVPGSCPLTKIGCRQNTVVDKSIQLW